LGESLTLRFSKHRAWPSTGTGKESPKATEDVELNTLMNIVNRASGTTDEVFSEVALLKNHAFRPWPDDRPLDFSKLPHCTEAPRPPLVPRRN